MRPSKKTFGRTVRFEQLENRSLLAGNVMVAVNSGELDITGDNANNNIQVTQLASGQWKVSGIATKINNGNAAFKTDSGNPVTGNIVIDLSGGSDTLNVLHGAVPGALLINADDPAPQPTDGNDIVQVSNITTGLDTASTGNSLNISLCNGNNTATVTGVTTTGATDIESATGSAHISMSNVTVNSGDNAFNGIFPGQGSSVITLSNVKWTAGDGGVNDIDLLSPGKTAISLSNVSWTVGTDGINGIFTNSPQSIVALAKVTMTSGDRSKNIVATEAGTSVISLANVNMTTGDGGDGNIVFAGPGNASIALANVKMQAGTDTKNTIETHDGTAAIAMSNVAMNTNSFSTNMIETGNGVDTFSFTNLNMNCGGFASNSIEAGNGTTVMSLINLHMTCDGFASNDITAGNGHVVIALVNSNLSATSTNAAPTSNNIETGNGNDTISLSRVAVAGPLTIDSGDGRDAVALTSVTDPGGDLNVDVGPGNYDTLSVVNCTAGTEELSDTGGTNGTIVGAANHFAAPPSVSGFRYRIGS